MTNIVFQLPEDLAERVARHLKQDVVEAVRLAPPEQPRFRDYMTPEEASEAVGGHWSASTISRRVKSGDLPGVVEGHVVMVYRPGLEERWNAMREKKKGK